MTTLRQVLATPYIMTMRAVNDGTGWVREAECPELDGCVVTAPAAWDAIDLLEAHIWVHLLSRIEAGRPVPAPRPPLTAQVVDTELRRRGWDDLVPILDDDIATLAGHDFASVIGEVPS